MLHRLHGGGQHFSVCLAIPQALFDLEATNTELKGDLRDLYITSAREIDIHNTTRKAIIVHVSLCEQLASLDARYERGSLA